MKKKIVILVFMLASCANSFSQLIDKSALIEKIKIKSGSFLLKEGEIDNLENLNSKLSIIEVLDIKVLGYNEIGIYRLYSHRSPSFTYILLKNKSAFEIIDLRVFANSFPKITRFLKHSGLDDSKKVKYLEKIIEIYNNNNYEEKIRL